MENTAVLERIAKIYWHDLGVQQCRFNQDDAEVDVGWRDGKPKFTFTFGDVLYVEYWAWLSENLETVELLEQHPRLTAITQNMHLEAAVEALIGGEEPGKVIEELPRPFAMRFRAKVPYQPHLLIIAISIEMTEHDLAPK